MGHMKRIWGEMTERERSALQTLNKVARGEFPPSHTGGEWLQSLAAKKARELEQQVLMRDEHYTPHALGESTLLR